jgi:hypothetical protein
MQVELLLIFSAINTEKSELLVTSKGCPETPLA